MQEIHTPISGEGASLSRRNFISIAAASTAATMPAVALADAAGKTGRLHQLSEPEVIPLDKQFDVCVENLRAVLGQMHPDAQMRFKMEIFNRGRDFWFLMTGNAPPTCEWAGDGIYEVAEAKYVPAGSYLVRRIYSHMDRREIYRAVWVDDGQLVEPSIIIDPNQLVRKLEGGAQ